MQNARFEYMFEYLCISTAHGKIAVDASDTLLNLLADVKCYDGMISREVNFRPGDLSSVFSNGNSFSYLKQLFGKDGASVADRIEKTKPSLFLVTHQLMGCIDAAFSAFSDRLRVVEMVRHPLYLLDHWNSYISMHGNNARDFTIWLGDKSDSVPWFADGWESEYLSINDYDKSVRSVCLMMDKVLTVFEQGQNSEQIMFVPFENFVLDPSPYLGRLVSFLDTAESSQLKRILKKQKVPRKSINAGPVKSIYKRYAMRVHDSAVSDEEDYNQMLQLAQSKASGTSLRILMKTISRYETAFGRWF